MPLFKITDIVDGNVIRVTGWQYGEYTGKKVKIAGYQITDLEHNSFSKAKLEILLKDQQVELKNVIKVEKGESDGEDMIICSVFLNDVNIAEYFPALAT